MADTSTYSCSCADWKENLDLLNSAFVMQSIHGFGGYTGKPFVFCPWCGKTLPHKYTKEKLT